jgi:hypothetical protein
MEKIIKNYTIRIHEKKYNHIHYQEMETITVPILYLNYYNNYIIKLPNVNNYVYSSFM